MKKYYWSTELECIDGGVESSIKACILEASETYDNIRFVYIGEYAEYKPYLSGEDIVEQLQENAYHQSDGISEDYGWLDFISKEVVDELGERVSKIINNILNKHNLKPNFGAVKDQKKHEICGKTKNAPRRQSE